MKFILIFILFSLLNLFASPKKFSKPDIFQAYSKEGLKDLTSNCVAKIKEYYTLSDLEKKINDGDLVKSLKGCPKDHPIIKLLLSGCFENNFKSLTNNCIETIIYTRGYVSSLGATFLAPDKDLNESFKKISDVKILREIGFFSLDQKSSGAEGKKYLQSLNFLAYVQMEEKDSLSYETAYFRYSYIVQNPEITKKLTWDTVSKNFKQSFQGISESRRYDLAEMIFLLMILYTRPTKEFIDFTNEVEKLYPTKGLGHYLRAYWEFNFRKNKNGALEFGRLAQEKDPHSEKYKKFIEEVRQTDSYEKVIGDVQFAMDFSSFL